MYIRIQCHTFVICILCYQFQNSISEPMIETNVDSFEPMINSIDNLRNPLHSYGNNSRSLVPSPRVSPNKCRELMI